VRTYETLFIVNPDLEESEISKTIESIEEIITSGGGKVLKVDRWGRRQLAYMIQNKREGYYVLIYFEAPQTLLVELNRRYKLATDTIMRSLVLQLRKGQIDEILEAGSLADTSRTMPAFDENGHYDEDGGYPEDLEEPVASTEG
jgi:small subunit ribosomal protein S6